MIRVRALSFLVMLTFLAGCSAPAPGPTTPPGSASTCLDGADEFPLQHRENSSWGYRTLALLTANGTLYAYRATDHAPREGGPELVNVTLDDGLAVAERAGAPDFANARYLTRVEMRSVDEALVQESCVSSVAALRDLPERDDRTECYDGSDVTYALRNATLREEVTVYCGGMTAHARTLAAAWCRIFGGVPSGSELAGCDHSSPRTAPIGATSSAIHVRRSP